MTRQPERAPLSARKSWLIGGVLGVAYSVNVFMVSNGRETIDAM